MDDFLSFEEKNKVKEYYNLLPKTILKNEKEYFLTGCWYVDRIRMTYTSPIDKNSVSVNINDDILHSTRLRHYSEWGSLLEELYNKINL